jgi:LysR family hydrogen peroxide-inducible transcriptional activator
VAPALRRLLPDLQVVWSEDKTRPLLEQIDDGRLDGAIVALDGAVAHLEHALLGDDPFVLAAAPAHRLVRHRRPAAPEVLDGATVYLLEDGHCFRDQALAFCGAEGAIEANLKATGLSTLVQMVAGGDGVTLLPKLAVPVENRRGQLAVRAFRSPVPTRRLVLVWRKGSAMKRPLGALAVAIRKAWPKE